MEFIFGLIIFVAAWIIINNIVAYASGWQDLATAYPALNKPDGKRFLFRSGFGHGWCLVFVVSREELYIRALFPFSIGSPPVLIPLSDIEMKGMQSIGLRGVKVKFKKIDRIFDLPQDVVEAVNDNRNQ